MEKTFQKGRKLEFYNEKDKNYLKLDLIALSVSAVIHILFLATIHIKENVLKTSEFEVVDFNAFSLETEVESNLISLRSNPGKSKSVSNSKTKVEIPTGKAVKKSSKAATKTPILPKKAAKRNGEISVKKNISYKYGKKLSAASKKEKSKTIGNVGYTISISDSAGKNGKSPLSDLKVKASKLAPYIREVKKKIMKNWQNTRLKKDEKLLTIISFTIDKNGKIESFNIEKISKDSLFNDSAVKAIYNSAPFPEIPESANTNKITVKVKFEVK